MPRPIRLFGRQESEKLVGTEWAVVDFSNHALNFFFVVYGRMALVKGFSPIYLEIYRQNLPLYSDL